MRNAVIGFATCGQTITKMMELVHQLFGIKTGKKTSFAEKPKNFLCLNSF